MSHLLEWFKKYGRHDLPWRKTDNPYRIYVSEIMLQQTQVERVLDKYHLFLQRFPTLTSLAMASDEELLSLWSGLGYYRRVLAMKKCAKECGENLPKEVKELQKLPGIGKYTAHAIASFAYNMPVPVVDVNIERVLRRYFALSGSQKEVWQKAAEFLNTNHPKAHNLALMDLGAMVCTIHPKCAECPLQKSCVGKIEPLRFWSKKQKTREKLTLHFALVQRGDKVAFVSSNGSMYRGMLLLPKIAPTTKPIAHIKHNYTKYNIDAYLYKEEREGDFIWIDRDEIDLAPIPTLVLKLLRVASSRHV